jgi:lipopolysaccharide assembly outer membrane protein LptD (OstA)
MRSRVLAAAGAMMLALCSTAAAQQDECNLIENVRVDVQPTTVFVQGPFLFRCASGAELQANFGTLNRLTHELLLVGNVDYRDAQQTLTSDQATYTSITRRLYATG